MGACIYRNVNAENVLDVFDEARIERQKSPDQMFKKFSKSSDKDRFVLTRLLGRKPIKVSWVGFHKPSLQETFIRKNHGSEYNYLLKFILERISWAARDADPQGDHKCDIVLSSQKMYPFETTLQYIERLRRGIGRYNTRANWEHIGEFSHRPHENEQDTHIADITASAFHMAIEPKEHQMTDERFLMNLGSRLYRGNNNRPHGLKLWPDEAVRPAIEQGRLRFVGAFETD
ncbi:MAG: hypothetical protein CME85_15775 [Henriciella sp.]|nr:hypothetical protein [Henriciella sp.]